MFDIFFSNVENPLDYTEGSALIFFTRWITHFCAPNFVLLAGISTYLYASRPGTSLQQTSWFLATRGLWFVICEFTIIFFIWTFYLVPFVFGLGIFWIMGSSMLLFSFLIFLPRWLLASVTIVLIIGHNAFDSTLSSQFAHGANLWKLVHEGGTFEFFNTQVVAVYPMLPWVGVMAFGYLLGPVIHFPEPERRRFFLVLGSLLSLAFIVLRYSNVYGDPIPWSPEQTFLLTVLSFLNCEKYPPSLLYLLMTLGPSFIFYGIITENFCRKTFGRFIAVYGQVPFFFYILHVPIILGSALLFVYLRGGKEVIPIFMQNNSLFGYNTFIVYSVWIAVTLFLYYPCKWYSQIKSNNKSVIWSYL